MTTRTPCDYYIPEGFVGWAEVHFAVKTSPVLPLVHGRFQIRLGPDAKLSTSTKFEEGNAHDRYYSYSSQSSHELAVTGWDQGGQVWAAGTEGSYSKDDDRITERFFVGTQRQYYRAVHDPRGN